MIFDSARAALAHLTSQEFRAVLFKSLGLSIVALIGLWFALNGLIGWMAIPYLAAFLPDSSSWAHWLSITATILAGITIAILLAFLVAPVTALIAGIFLDDVAERVEKADFPDDRPGQALSVVQSTITALKFFGIVILGNLLALLLLLIPGVNIAAFFVVNAYLLSREYFEFAAMRFMPESQAKALRRRHSGTVFTAGLIIAGFLAIPIVNLATPLFAAAMMVHLYKRLSKRDELRALRA